MSGFPAAAAATADDDAATGGAFPSLSFPFRLNPVSAFDDQSGTLSTNHMRAFSD
jgi:hypothetical protein